MFIQFKNSIPAVSASVIISMTFLSGGCAGPGAHTVETGSSQTITTVGQIDDQDFAAAARKLSMSMISSEGLFAPNADGTKKVVAVSRTKIDTAQVVDVDILMDQIKGPLLESGKATISTIGSVGNLDPSAKNAVEGNDFRTGDGSTKFRAPDYTLTTHLSQTHASAEGVRQNTFYFSMTLTETTNGTAVWTKQVPITKIGSHNSVGL